jgi:hypothetical protein
MKRNENNVKGSEVKWVFGGSKWDPHVLSVRLNSGEKCLMNVSEIPSMLGGIVFDAVKPPRAQYRRLTVNKEKSCKRISTRTKSKGRT